MKFFEKLDRYFHTLRFALGVEPEALIQVNNKLFLILLPIDTFFALSNKWEFEYIINHEDKIMELYYLAKNEKINFKEILNLIDRKENEYFTASPIVFKEQINKIHQVHKKNNPLISKNELSKKEIDFDLFITEKRKLILEQLKERFLRTEQIENKIIENQIYLIQKSEKETNEIKKPNKYIRKKPIKIEIVEQKQNETFELLKQYFDDSEVEIFKKIIQGDIYFHLKRLNIKCTNIQLIDIFRQMIDLNLIIGTKELLKVWLYKNFNCGTKESIKSALTSKNYVCKNPIDKIII